MIPVAVHGGDYIKTTTTLFWGGGEFASQGAVFSADGMFRYVLWRIWDATKPLLAFTMLNPSSADHEVLDPTVRRCVTYGQRWGFGGLLVGNIFALRSTHPEALYALRFDPIGEHNDFYLDEIHRRAKQNIAAWGHHGAFCGRGDQVWRRLSQYQPVYALAETTDKYPRHPLYLKGDLKPRVYIIP